jgi:hypothetical protein
MRRFHRTAVRFKMMEKIHHIRARHSLLRATVLRQRQKALLSVALCSLAAEFELTTLIVSASLSRQV